ncbi:MAG: Ldh family oxidoreductase [Alphaproteobacteria bacterium]|jgi:L-2-hydroxycarboxylate dehydrogenase (NAD+)|nr:Ldh family oxidoreductase [Alphaproteobacteria bacterium]MBT5798992.1 Ldh family oxidoreductase [Alphaproteobacteria bacterium]
MTHLVTALSLTHFIKSAFLATGFSNEHAETTAQLMVQADISGQDGHGVFRLPQYIKRLQEGGMNPKPDFKILSERVATALIDGDNGIGHLVMRHAADIAVEKARTTGVAWVGARMSNHAGPASLYSRYVLDQGMIGIYVAVGSANHMPPWGGTDMMLSTNPISVAVPSGKNPPIILDMATTVAAYGKVKTLLQSGGTMPEGWMSDKHGNPITDPAKSGDGFLLPIGGPKGYGLALIFGILAGTLNGAAFGSDVTDFNADNKTISNTGQFIIALNIEAFMDIEQFKSQIDKVWEDMKSSAKLPGVDEIRLPGENLARTIEKRTASGIEIPKPLFASLTQLADELSITRLS